MDMDRVKQAIERFYAAPESTRAPLVMDVVREISGAMEALDRRVKALEKAAGNETGNG
jgi:hypothetical protein